MKKNSQVMINSHSEVMEEILKMKKGMHNIIEYLASKEQTQDLEGFLRRESNFNFEDAQDDNG